MAKTNVKPPTLLVELTMIHNTTYPTFRENTAYDLEVFGP